jgi:acetyl-CoA carboxylase biotin carboxylase subunit
MSDRSERGFTKGKGRVRKAPEGNGIRVDSHCYTGYFVPSYYDSLLAKLIVKGDDRTEAVDRMAYALANFEVNGVDTTIPFYRNLMENPDYLHGKINTRWIEDVFI